MHIIPFLTFGDPRNMKILLEHFAPYLNFERFGICVYLYLYSLLLSSHTHTHTHTHTLLLSLSLFSLSLSLRFDSEETPEHSLYLDCFSAVATGIGVSYKIMYLKSF